MSQRFFEIIPSDMEISFTGKFPFLFGISVVLVVACVVVLFSKGLQYGVDFEGGTQVHIRFQAKPSADQIRDALKPIGLQGASVQGYGEEGSGEFLVRVGTIDLNLASQKVNLEKQFATIAPGEKKEMKVQYSEDRIYVRYAAPIEPEKLKEAVNSLGLKGITAESVAPFGRSSDHEYLVQFSGVSSRMVQAFEKSFGKGKFEVLQVEQVGPKVGAELRMQAIGAVLISLLFILIYVWFRFEFEFAPGAVAALVHDALLVLGVFSFMGLQFDLSTVAAVLTIVGYSINDTIVLYDRVRENMKKSASPNITEIINLSINQVLGRTIILSLTALMATVALMVLGGPITYNFALAFTVGIVVGTYSSSFVASPITVYVHQYLSRRKHGA